ncbi:permease-like cell division protein FtsX [Ruminococcus flavefaciens]|uniref:permease-like cell division protein FtsX n=1 Tax=Ruminococcus flavefaciens TaxID=1265 RepID=UPI0026EA95A0|nr:permease-like cell division protein FtsX [Ruminococcus flavefaciens]
MKLSGIRYLADQGVENIWKNKMMAFATFCVLLISLLLVGIAGLFYINLNSMIKGLGSQNEVVVLMNVGTTEEQNSAAEEAIKALPNIDKVEFVSKEDALARQKASLPNAEKIFNDYIGDDASFMPDGFSVTVKNTDKITETTEKIGALANIQSASASPQVAEFLRELRKVVSLIAGAIIAALAVVSMIIISNTTKASVFARREEIQIMKYVGATNAFIRLPFFVEGMVTGFFAGAGAYFITWAIYSSAYNMIKEQGMLMNTFGVSSLIPFDKIQFIVILAYLVAGALIGALGSVVSTRKHIDV